MLKKTTITTCLSIFAVMALLIATLPNTSSTAAVSIEQSSADQNTLILGTFDASLNTTNGLHWMRSEDRVAGGESLADVSYHKSLGAMQVQATVKQGFAYPWAGAALFAHTPIEASPYNNISFDIRGTAGQYLLMMFSGEIGVAPPMQSFAVTGEWQTVSFKLKQFQNLDMHAVKGLAIVASPAPGEFEYIVDNVKLN